jgi:hypothetical protein
LTTPLQVKSCRFNTLVATVIAWASVVAICMLAPSRSWCLVGGNDGQASFWLREENNAHGDRDHAGECRGE